MKFWASFPGVKEYAVILNTLTLKSGLVLDILEVRETSIFLDSSQICDSV